MAREMLGAKLLPVFVPPWNRISRELAARTCRAWALQALSTFTDRKTASSGAGLLQINTHVDPIDWHGTRSLADPAEIVARLAGSRRAARRRPADRDEPIGFLTHHLVHDDVIWSLCERLIAQLASRGIRFLRPDRMFQHRNRITFAI